MDGADATEILNQVDIIEQMTLRVCRPDTLGLSIGKVNIESRTLEDVIMVEVGEAEGHGYEIEASFLTDMLKYVKQELKGRVQCNSGHNWDQLYYQLGRFDGLYLSEDKKSIKAKTLKIYKAANSSPMMTGMADWFLELASEDPQAVMCSISFKPKGFYQYDDKGHKVYIQYYRWYGPEKVYQDRPAYAEFEKLYSCDIVDEGALTRSLLSEQHGAHSFAALSKALNNPELLKKLSENEEDFAQLRELFQPKIAFNLSKIFSNIFKPSSMDKNKEKETPEKEEASKGASEKGADTTTPDPLAELNKKFDELKEQLAAKDKEIEELAEKAAAVPTSVKTDDESRSETSKGRSWEGNPINIKAQKMGSRLISDKSAK